jgi:hypothetical protein
MRHAPHSAMGRHDRSLSHLDSPVEETAKSHEDAKKNTTSKMAYISVALAVLSAGVAIGAYNDVPHRRFEIPAQAQFIDQKAFNVLPSVLPPSEFNLTNVSILPSRSVNSGHGD